MSKDSINNPIIRKILDADADTYIIFYIEECPYCLSALELLRNSNVKYKGYIIDKISGGMPELLNVLTKYSRSINFNVNHQTKPIIFYNRKFLGGANELSDKLKK